MDSLNQFMVDFTLPEALPTDFFDIIPNQTAAVQKYLSLGKLVHYAFSVENAKIWAIFNADSEMEVMEMLIDFPITPYTQVQISLLDAFHVPSVAPAFSLNQGPSVGKQKKPDSGGRNRALLKREQKLGLFSIRQFSRLFFSFLLRLQFS
eukprot:TRINITY_DN7596_c0_g8_i2.p2 TRINITY_DN7596_c0_g8~~TRINITY_DN7596_c0_g8_i2.p2  ORF type:complete len:150 (-),score=9.65 TRINITY_DN7596_c0_g8_i2:286-735(-)